MSRMGKIEENWNGLKLGFLKTVQPNNFFAYFKFHSDWGRVIGKVKQNELDCVTQPI